MIPAWSSAVIFTTMFYSKGNDVSWHLENNTPRIWTLVRPKCFLFHIPLPPKTHDKYHFEWSCIELNLGLTNLEHNLNGGCKIVGVVQTLWGWHFVGINVWKFVWYHTPVRYLGLTPRRIKSASDIYKDRHLRSFTSFSPFPRPSWPSPHLPPPGPASLLIVKMPCNSARWAQGKRVA